MEWETVIGLEVHVQLLTRTKAFCFCPAVYGDEPNTHVCPVCLGLPGALPVPNREMVERALRIALALGSEIHATSIWARKNYFYPDLPKGYQISQFDRPLATGGVLPMRLKDGVQRVRITRLHLEDDAGKSFHGAPDDATSLVDFNRCGVPLAEIVTEPDLRSPDEAAAFMKALRQLVVHLGACDGNLEQGNLRCDANLSVRPRGETALRTRSEVKNVNSYRHLRLALEYEQARHIAAYESGGVITQETRLFDAARGVTFPMRSKEDAHDYRYFPEPDLPPLVVDREWIERVKAALPETPWAKHERFVGYYGLSDHDAAALTDEQAVADFFETVAARVDPKLAANWVMGDLTALWKERGVAPEQSSVTPAALAELIELIQSGAISGKIAKEVLAAVADGAGSPRGIVAERGLGQISDERALAAIVDEVLAANAQQVEQYRSGKTTVFGFFVGQVMKRTKGQANPRLVNELLTRKLGPL